MSFVGELVVLRFLEPLLWPVGSDVCIVDGDMAWSSWLSGVCSGAVVLAVVLTGLGR